MNVITTDLHWHPIVKIEDLTDNDGTQKDAPQKDAPQKDAPPEQSLCISRPYHIKIIMAAKTYYPTRFMFGEAEFRIYEQK